MKFALASTWSLSWRIARNMKRAQIITIGVALAAGAGVLYMMSNQKPPPAPVIASMPAPPPPIPTDDVLVAARELPMGTLIAEPDLQWVGWPRTAAGPGMIKKSELPNAVDDIKGSVARGSFFQGEPIRREKVVKGPNSGFLSAILPSGKRAVAINIDASGSTTAGGFILPNDHVDILRTRRDEDAIKSGGPEAYVTDVLLSNMRVLAIGQNVQEKNGERVVVGSNATLEADPREAEILIMAQRTGQLSMTLRSMLDAKKSDAPVADRPEQAGVTVVRFGVATALGKK